MVVVDYTATKVRDNLTTLSNWLSIGTSTSDAITISSTTINSVVTTIQVTDTSYPSSKKFTNEYLLDANTANGSIINRIAIKETSTTTQVITLSNLPEIEKNALIEIVFDVTLEVENE
jgi:hypothetical protein